MVILIILLLITCIFLANELFKKFGFQSSYANKSGQLFTWHYPGADGISFECGMRKVALRSSKQFGALIGIQIDLFGRKWFDPYGYIESNDQGEAIFKTYLGKNPGDFVFLIAGVSPDEVTIEINNSIQAKRVEKKNVYKPHWWQKYIGI